LKDPIELIVFVCIDFKTGAFVGFTLDDRFLNSITRKAAGNTTWV
jgi:hypothetical protein